MTQGPDGKFVSADDIEQYDDVEVQSVGGGVITDFDGSTPSTNSEEYEGIQVLDMDDLLDRNEQASLLLADMYAVPSADWGGDNPDPDFWRHYIEVGTASVLQKTAAFGDSGDNATISADPDVAVITTEDDSLDLLGRPLRIRGQLHAKDTTNTLGAGGDFVADRVVSSPADPRFHPRDEIFMNVSSRYDNVSGANEVGFNYEFQFVFGVEPA